MLKLVTLASLVLAAVTAQTLESDGWTPVTSSQVVNLPSRFNQRPDQQQQPFRQPERPSAPPPQQEPFRPKAETQQDFRQPQPSSEAEVSPYLPDLERQRPDYENQWDGFYGTKPVTEETSPSQPTTTEQARFKDEVVEQPQQSENDILQPEADEIKKDGGESVNPETEKPPLIIYPAASIDETPLSDRPVDVQTPAQTVPDFLQPKRNQASPAKKPQPPTLQRFPPPGQPPVPRGQPPQPAGTPRQPLPPRPTGAQPPRLRGAPRRPLPPRGPPQQALPRNSVVGPPPVRARPPLRRPYPPRRPAPSLFEKAKCAAEDLVVDGNLNNRAFLQSQLNCILDKGPCDKTGQLLKRIGPDVLKGGCPPPCNACKRTQINKAITRLKEDFPREFQQVRNKFLTRSG